MLTPVRDSSKPIRRPQLKKVLKEYCAPIPEENEEVTPPEIHPSGGGNTTIVMVNGPAVSDTQAEQKAAAMNAKPPRAASSAGPRMPPAVVERVQNGAGSEPVSPMSG